MIQGKVLPTGEATVQVQVRGTNGQVANVEAMIDTGFNDEMTLPAWVIWKLNMKFVNAADYTLADGLTSAARIFEGEIAWHGTWREVLVVEIENDALVGMSLLEGCNVNMDVVAGGRVEIRPLTFPVTTN